jgi:hypothetical protein
MQRMPLRYRIQLILGRRFLDNLQDVQITVITGADVTVNLGAPPVTGCEVRRTDSGWGRNDQNRIAVFSTQTFVLARGRIDQTWYIRQVNGAKSSRVSRVLRVVYPLVPSTPSVTVDITDVFHPLLTFSILGDVRNVAGIEIRDSDNATVLLQRRYFSTADLQWAFDNSTLKQRNFTWYLYTFDLQWEYSLAAVLTFSIPAPAVSLSFDAPGQAVVGALTAGSSETIEYQVFKDVSLTMLSASGTQASNTDANGAAVNRFLLTVEDVVQERWLRARGADALGQGSWSSTLYHLYVTTGVNSFDNTNNLESVALPPTPDTPPTYGAPFDDIAPELVDYGFGKYQKRQLLR